MWYLNLSDIKYLNWKLNLCRTSGHAVNQCPLILMAIMLVGISFWTFTFYFYFYKPIEGKSFKIMYKVKGPNRYMTLTQLYF